MIRTSFAVFALSLVGMVTLPARAADAPDLSTPKKAAVAYARAIESGDLTAVKTTAIGTENDFSYIESIIGLIGANKELRAAAIEKFGEDGKQISKDDLSTISRQAEQGEEKIDGDTATVGKPDDREP